MDADEGDDGDDGDDGDEDVEDEDMDPTVMAPAGRPDTRR
jgi:hypothetical protein